LRSGTRGIQLSPYQSTYRWLSIAAVVGLCFGFQVQPQKPTSPPLFKVEVETIFAKQTAIQLIVPQEPASVRFFHFRIPKGIPADDDLRKMLKPVNPQTTTVSDGLSFRKELAALISRLENLAH
jgi:hypothetical protein